MSTTNVPEPKTFNIIRHRGALNKVTLINGVTVTRSPYIFIPEWRRTVPCAPYDEHFVYANDIINIPTLMCTCGSPAVITDPYTPAKSLLVCLKHATDGLHVGSDAIWQ